MFTDVRNTSALNPSTSYDASLRFAPAPAIGSEPSPTSSAGACGGGALIQRCLMMAKQVLLKSN